MPEIRTVLCPVDYTSLSERELRLASRICEMAGARLVIEHNMDPAPPPQMGVAWMHSEEHRPRSENVEDAEKHLKEILDRLPRSLAREARLTRGPLDLSLLYVARDVDADLIVMGSHGRSTVDHHSVTEEILSKAPCSVLTLAEESRRGALLDHTVDESAPESLTALVPVAFSRRGQALLDHAFETARTLRLRLRLLRVDCSREAPGRAPAKETEDRIRALVPPDLADRAACEVVAGQPREEILARCESPAADLLIMSRDRGGLFRAPCTGTPPREIVHDAPCPVWFVPGTTPRVRPAGEPAPA